MGKRLLALVIFGIAFAFVESSVVVYLRELPECQGDCIKGGYQMLLNLKAIAFVIPQNPHFIDSYISSVELLREFATLIMLFTISYLLGRTLMQKIGVFLISFAVWDIFYYIFLRIITGWPKTLLDIDVYFLIPIPWIGPVITPLVISTVLLMVGLVLFFRQEKIQTVIFLPSKDKDDPIGQQ